jgi:tetratricopeptide (TPR) repeat protein
MANVLSLEARRFSTFNEGNEALMKLQPDIVGLRNQAGAIWKSIRNPAEKERLREPWLMYSLALAQAWGRAGNVNEMQSIVRDLASVGGFEQRMEPFVLEAMVKTEMAMKEEPNAALQESLCAKAQQTYNELIQKLPADDANKERRLRAYNNAAWMLAWRGGYASSEATYQQAIQRLNEALRLAPDDYVVNRNMAVILKRFKKPPLAPGPFVEKCAAVAAADKQWAEDFDALKKYMEAK